MAKTIGQFDFEIIHGKSAIPHPPIIHIIPKHFSRDQEGWPRLSPELMSEIEIDGYIRACKEDLDSVGERAKAAFKRARKDR